MGKDEPTEKFNLSLPPPLMAEFYRVGKAAKRGKKKQLLTAAVLLFLEVDPNTAETYLERAGAVLATENYDKMLADIAAARAAHGGGKRRLRPRMAVRTEGGVQFQE